jgi:predicted enzyme related to lactoylglutathione lyase
MDKDKYAPGEPCWIDCGTDVKKATAFYSALFGWKVDDLGPDAGGYCMATLDGKPVAGFGPQQNPGPPFWSVYFATHSANHTAEKVKESGGSVLMEPMDVMEAGRMAVLTDPLGAAFSVWEPNQMHGFGKVDEPGTFCWPELVTTDLTASASFYREVFGWTDKRGDDPSMEYVEYQLGVTSVAGMMPKTPDMPAEAPPFWTIYFAVEDTDATLAKVAELGGATVAGPMDVPVGRFAVCADTAGAMFCVIRFAQG